MPSEAMAGRSTVWGPSPKPDLRVEITPSPPIFLVGERAERERLAKLLDGRDGISCSPDSELLVDLAGAVRRNAAALSHYGYPEQYWFRRVAGFFDVLQMEYAASRRLTRWAATAEPGALATLDRLFPRSRIVRILPDAGSTRAKRTARAELDLTRQLSSRYYQLMAPELRDRADAAIADVLKFLDPLVEATRSIARS